MCLWSCSPQRVIDGRLKSFFCLLTSTVLLSLVHIWLQRTDSTEWMNAFLTPTSASLPRTLRGQTSAGSPQRNVYLLGGLEFCLSDHLCLAFVHNQEFISRPKWACALIWTDKSGVLWACLFLDPTASPKTNWDLQAGEEWCCNDFWEA